MLHIGGAGQLSATFTVYPRDKHLSSRLLVPDRTDAWSGAIGAARGATVRAHRPSTPLRPSTRWSGNWAQPCRYMRSNPGEYSEIEDVEFAPEAWDTWQQLRASIQRFCRAARDHLWRGERLPLRRALPGGNRVDRSPLALLRVIRREGTSLPSRTSQKELTEGLPTRVARTFFWARAPSHRGALSRCPPDGDAFVTTILFVRPGVPPPCDCAPPISA
jgi:hypothetical protein